MGTFPSPCEATQSGVFNVVVTKPDIFNETWERILPVAFTVTASSHFVVTKPDIFNEEPGNFDLILLRLQEVFQLCVCVCVCGHKTRSFKSKQQHLCLNVTGRCKTEM